MNYLSKVKKNVSQQAVKNSEGYPEEDFLLLDYHKTVILMLNFNP